MKAHKGFMSNNEDFVNLLEEDEKFFENLRQRIAGMGEEADKLRQLHENVESEVKQLEGKINDTLEKVEEAEKHAHNAMGQASFRENRKDELNPSEYQKRRDAVSTIEDVEEEDERVKNHIQQFAKLVREIEEDTKEIKKLIGDAEDKIKEEFREFENLDKADRAVAKIESKMERLNSNLPDWNGI